MSFMSLKSTAIGLAASLMLLATAPASAASFSFSGAFSGDADVQLFSFTVGSGTTVSLSTTSYALGGFDPLLTVFDSSGIALQDLTIARAILAKADARL